MVHLQPARGERLKFCDKVLSELVTIVLSVILKQVASDRFRSRSFKFDVGVRKVLQFSHQVLDATVTGQPILNLGAAICVIRFFCIYARCEEFLEDFSAG